VSERRRRATAVVRCKCGPPRRAGSPARSRPPHLLAVRDLAIGLEGGELGGAERGDGVATGRFGGPTLVLSGCACVGCRVAVVRVCMSVSVVGVGGPVDSRIPGAELYGTGCPCPGPLTFSHLPLVPRLVCSLHACGLHQADSIHLIGPNKPRHGGAPALASGRAAGKADLAQRSPRVRRELHAVPWPAWPACWAACEEGQEEGGSQGGEGGGRSRRPPPPPSLQPLPRRWVLAGRGVQHREERWVRRAAGALYVPAPPPTASAVYHSSARNWQPRDERAECARGTTARGLVWGPAAAAAAGAAHAATRQGGGCRGGGAGVGVGRAAPAAAVPCCGSGELVLVLKWCPPVPCPLWLVLVAGWLQPVAGLWCRVCPVAMQLYDHPS
jgi:hypothetical protein